MITEEELKVLVDILNEYKYTYHIYRWAVEGEYGTTLTVLFNEDDEGVTEIRVEDNGGTIVYYDGDNTDVLDIRDVVDLVERFLDRGPMDPIVDFFTYIGGHHGCTT